MQLECLVDYGCHIGKNHLWHPLENRIYWCDIPKGRIYRFDPATGAHEQCYEGRNVDGFTIQTDGSLLLFMDRGTVETWHEGKLSTVQADILEELDSRFNDVIADPIGRVFYGTMSSGEKQGSLYRLDLDGSLHRVLTGIGCSNGMAFTPDRRGFYYTDSFVRKIYHFDYLADHGTLHNQRVFAHFEESDGLPDGATVDAEGRLWSAFWDGGCVRRLDSRGEVDLEICLPAPKTLSLIFGGEDYGDIYITTAAGDRKFAEGPLAGALFRLRIEARGVPEFFSRIRIHDSVSEPKSSKSSESIMYLKENK